MSLQSAHDAAAPLTSAGSQSSGIAASGATMQPLPWSDPSLRFSSAPVVDDDEQAEEFQTTSASAFASATASSEDTTLSMLQQAEQVRHTLRLLS